MGPLDKHTLDQHALDSALPARRNGECHSSDWLTSDCQWRALTVTDDQSQSVSGDLGIESMTAQDQHGLPREATHLEGPPLNALAVEFESQEAARRARRLRDHERRKRALNEARGSFAWLTIESAAALLQVSVSTLYRWSKLPGFPVARSHRMTRIHRQQLLEWADEYFAARQSGRPLEPTPRPRRRKQ